MLLKEPYKISRIKILESVNYPFEIWAYGSSVNGTAHDGRDLDLVIRTPDLSCLPSAMLPLHPIYFLGSNE
jgi:uncharacterized protein